MWKLNGWNEERASYVITDQVGNLVCEIFTDTPEVNAEKCESNALLISRAPLMQETLKSILNVLDGQINTQQIRILIERALSKT